MPRPIAAVGNLLVDAGTGAATFFLITFLVPIFHVPYWLLVIIILRIQIFVFVYYTNRSIRCTCHAIDNTLRSYH